MHDLPESDAAVPGRIGSGGPNKVAGVHREQEERGGEREGDKGCCFSALPDTTKGSVPCLHAEQRLGRGNKCLRHTLWY